MTAQIKELKTNRTRTKEGMLEFLEALTKRIKEDEIESIIFVFSDSNQLINSMVIGDVNFTEAIGMMAVGQTALQMSHFYGSPDDDGE